MNYLEDGESIIFTWCSHVEMGTKIVGSLPWVKSLKTALDMKICVKVICYEVLPGEITRGRGGRGKEKEGRPNMVAISRVQYCGAFSPHRELLWLSPAGGLWKWAGLHCRIVSMRAWGLEYLPAIGEIWSGISNSPSSGSPRQPSDTHMGIYWLLG